MRTESNWIRPSVSDRISSFFFGKKSYSHIAPQLLDRLQSDKTDSAIHSLAQELLTELNSLTFQFFKLNRAGFKQIAEKLNQLNICPELAKKCKQIAICPEAFEAALALRQGVKPKSISVGVSGVYFLNDRLGRPIGVFKPAELEVNIPDALFSTVMSDCQFTPGTSYQRERAAYLLDREHFASVPHTITVRLPRACFKDSSLSADRDPFVTGSFQVFIPEASHFTNVEHEDLNPHEIHKIAILDIRILNADRHSQNALVDGNHIVYPIDHGLCLLDSAERLRFDWMKLPEADAPWSAEELAYIAKIDSDKDTATLRKKIPSLTEETLLRCKIATLLLKKGASRGLTAFQIGDLMLGKTTNHSYFELRIVPRIFKNPSMMDLLLDLEIDHYLNP